MKIGKASDLVAYIVFHKEFVMPLCPSFDHFHGLGGYHNEVLGQDELLTYIIISVNMGRTKNFGGDSNK